MKRTCRGCKALTNTDNWYCSLGYKTTTKKEFNGIVLEIKPIENCPKPLTNNDYITYDEYNKLRSL